MEDGWDIPRAILASHPSSPAKNLSLDRATSFVLGSSYSLHLTTTAAFIDNQIRKERLKLPQCHIHWPRHIVC